jgi:hypothetical protein
MLAIANQVLASSPTPPVVAKPSESIPVIVSSSSSPNRHVATNTIFHSCSYYESEYDIDSETSSSQSAARTPSPVDIPTVEDTPIKYIMVQDTSLGASDYLHAYSNVDLHEQARYHESCNTSSIHLYSSSPSECMNAHKNTLAPALCHSSSDPNSPIPKRDTRRNILSQSRLFSIYIESETKRGRTWDELMEDEECFDWERFWWAITKGGVKL